MWIKLQGTVLVALYSLPLLPCYQCRQLKDSGVDFFDLNSISWLPISFEMSSLTSINPINKSFINRIFYFANLTLVIFCQSLIMSKIEQPP